MTAQRCTEREASRTQRLARAARSVDELRRAALAAEQEFASELNAAAPSMRESARNLVHYLSVRRHDVRELQDDLARLGMSSLGRMEAHVMASLQAVLEVLCALRKQPIPAEIAGPPITFDTGDALLAEHAEKILGPPRRGRETRIMVTRGAFTRTPRGGRDERRPDMTPCCCIDQLRIDAKSLAGSMHTKEVPNAQLASHL